MKPGDLVYARIGGYDAFNSYGTIIDHVSSYQIFVKMQVKLTGDNGPFTAHENELHLIGKLIIT